MTEQTHPMAADPSLHRAAPAPSGRSRGRLSGRGAVPGRRLQAGTALATLLAIGLVTAPALSQNVWQGPQDGDWGDAANWDPALPDGVGDIAEIDGPFVGETGRGVVDLSGGSFTLGTLTIGGAEGVRLENGTLSMEDAGTATIAVIEGGLETATDLGLVLVSDTDIDVAGGTTARLDGPISGDGALAATGAGVVELNAANSFTGGLTLGTGSTVLLGDADAAGTGEVTVGSSTLQVDSTLTLGNDLSINPASALTLSVADGETVTLTGALTRGGASTLTIGETGRAGTVVLDPSAVTIGGADAATQIAHGTLRLGSDPDVLNTPEQSTVVGSAGTLDLDGSDASVNRLFGSGSIIGGSGDASLRIAGDSDFEGTIGDAAHQVDLVVDAEVLLQGDSADIGDTQVLTGAQLEIGATGRINAVTVDNNGTLVVADGGSTGAVDNSGNVVNAGIIGALDNTGSATNNDGATIDGNVATSALFVNNGTVDGTLEVTSGSSQIGTSGEVTGNTTFSNGVLGVDGSIGGTLDVSGGLADLGASGSVAGDTAVTGGALVTQGSIGGTLTVGGSGVVNNSGSVAGGVIANGGTLTLSGGSYGAGIENTGGVLNVSGTLSGADTSISNEATMNVTGATDQGGGDLSNTGTINVNADHLNIGELSNLGDIDIADGAELAAETLVLNAGSVTLGAGSTLRGTGNTLNNAALITVGTDGAVVDAGDINNLGTGTILFEGPGGTASLSSGTGTITNDGSIALLSGGLDVTGSVTNSGIITLSPGAGPLDITGGFTQTAGSLGLADGDANVSGAVLLEGGAITGIGATLTAGSFTQRGGGVVAGVTLAADAFVFDGTVDITVDSVLADATGPATLLQSGSATTTLTADNTFTGQATVTDGTLEITGSIAGDALLENGTLDNAGTIGGNTSVVDGTLLNTGTIDGTLFQFGGIASNDGTIGSVVLTGTGDFTNTDTIGSLSMTGGTAENTASGTITGSATVADGTLTTSGSIGGNLVVNGSGNVELQAGGTVAGDAIVTVDGVLTADGEIGGDATVAGNGVLDATADIGGDATVFGLGSLSTTADVGGDADVFGNGTLDTSGNIGGDASVADSGSLTTSGDIGGDAEVSGGTLETTGDIAGTLAVSGGSATLTGGALGGDATVSGGALVSTADLGGGLAVSGGSATLTGGSLAGDASITGGSFDSSAALGGDVSIDGGSANLSGGSVAGDVALITGSLDTAADIAGALGVEGGVGVLSGGSIGGDASVSGGSLTGAAAIAGGLGVSGGSVDLTGGSVGGDASVSGGSLDSAADIGGGIAVSGGDATLSGGSVGGDATVSAGSLESAVAIAGGLDQSGGSVDLTGGSVGGDVAISDGVFDSVADLGGDLAMTDGTATLSAGTLSGDASVSGGSFTTGTGILGGLNVTGGAAEVLGTGSVGGATSLGGGSLDNAGTLAGLSIAGGDAANTGTIGGATSLTGGSFVNTGGTLTGALTNTGGAVTLLGGTYDGGIANTAGTLMASGTMAGANTSITNADQMMVTAALNQGGGNLTSSGTVTLDADYTNIGTLALSGTLTTTGPGVTPTLQAATIDGSPGARFALRGDGIVGQGLSIDADLTGSARMEMAGGVLQGAAGADTPVIDWTGELPGAADSLVLDFGLPAGGLVLQGLEIPVLQVTSGNVSGVSATGLPDAGGLVSAFLSYDDPTNTFNLVTATNPALGGVAGTVAAVDALIGTVVNRPTGAFVGPPLFETECIRGAWARGVGGRATGTTTTDSFLGAGGRLSLPSDVTVTYRGLQGGFDFGCYRAPEGWDIAGGITFGVNDGSSTQNVFNFTVDPVTGRATLLKGPGNLLSVTRGDFRQRYGGAYIAAARGDWFGEMQLRRERTRYTFDSRGVAGAPLPLNNARFNNDGTTLSGSISRGFRLGDGLSLTPTAGFGLTRTSGGTLDFVDAGGVAVGSLTTDSHTNRILFVGAGLGRGEVADDGFSATSRFVSVNFYGDFSPARRAQFVQAGGGAPIDLSTARQGSFGEVSVGISHFRIFETESGFNQLDVSLRGDLRFSNKIRSYGVTAQMRLQF